MKLFVIPSEADSGVEGSRMNKLEIPPLSRRTTSVGMTQA